MTAETVVMVSGGVDSTIAADRIPEARVVYVDYGQPYAPMESRAVSELFEGRASHVRISGLPPLGKDYYVPARNLMLATVGVRYGGRICFAGMRDEQCPDKNPEAFEDMSRILTSHCKRRIEVFSPFWGANKADAVRDYLARGGSPERMLATVSCYDGSDRPCGACEACFRRWVCLTVNGLQVRRPSDQVIRSYGLRLLHSFPARRRLTVLAAVHSYDTPVVKVDLSGHSSLGSLRSLRRVPGSYLVLYSGLPDEKRPGLVSMLRSEEVVYDSLLMATDAGFFERSWQRMKETP